MDMAAVPQNVVGALIGVGGVLIGGLLTFGANVLLDSRRDAREARAARVLFLQEINDALDTVREGSKARRWPLGWKPWPETWDSYRAAAAIAMEPSHFHASRDGVR